MKNKFLIRFFDVMFSSIAILILLPLFVLVIIILSLSGEGEIFYLQKRVGIHKKLFNVIKFATMMKNSEFISSVRSLTDVVYKTVSRHCFDCSGKGRYAPLKKDGTLGKAIRICKSCGSLLVYLD